MACTCVFMVPFCDDREAHKQRMTDEEDAPDPNCTICSGTGEYINGYGRPSGDPCNNCCPAAFEAFLAQRRKE